MAPRTSASVVGSSLGAFTLRFSSTLSGGTGALIFEYHKRAASILTAETITVTFVGTISYSQVVAFGVNGANATPYDPNASLPDGTVIPTLGSVSASTTNTNTVALVAERLNANSGTIDSGFTQIWNTNFFMMEYRPLTSAGSFTAVDATGTSSNGVILDAITQ
jgi:hypothetical protein